MANGSGAHPWRGLARAASSRTFAARGLLCAVASALILVVAVPHPFAEAAPQPPNPAQRNHWVLSDNRGGSYTYATAQVSSSRPPKVTLTGRRDPNLDAWRKNVAIGRPDRRDCTLTGYDTQGVARVRYKLTAAWPTKFSESGAQETVILVAESITRET
jgi:T4-like virus tail tube protein gp19